MIPVATNQSLDSIVLKQGNGLTTPYASFAEYALESSTTAGLSSVPVPVVKLTGQEYALSLPVITIIGAEVPAPYGRCGTVSTVTRPALSLSYSCIGMPKPTTASIQYVEYSIPRYTSHISTVRRCIVTIWFLSKTSRIPAEYRQKSISRQPLQHGVQLLDIRDTSCDCINVV